MLVMTAFPLQMGQALNDERKRCIFVQLSSLLRHDKAVMSCRRRSSHVAKQFLAVFPAGRLDDDNSTIFASSNDTQNEDTIKAYGTKPAVPEINIRKSDNSAVKLV